MVTLISLSGMNVVGVDGVERKRCQDYYLAREALFLVMDDNRDSLDVEVVRCHFERWHSSYVSGRYGRLYCVDDDSMCFPLLVNRFQEEYQDELVKKFERLDEVSWDLHLSLTVDPKCFMRLVDEFGFLKRGWQRLRS